MTRVTAGGCFGARQARDPRGAGAFAKSTTAVSCSSSTPCVRQHPAAPSRLTERQGRGTSPSQWTQEASTPSQPSCAGAESRSSARSHGTRVAAHSTCATPAATPSSLLRARPGRRMRPTRRASSNGRQGHPCPPPPRPPPHPFPLPLASTPQTKTSTHPQTNARLRRCSPDNGAVLDMRARSLQRVSHGRWSRACTLSLRRVSRVVHPLKVAG
jgi:hypothetical protein